MSRLLSAVGPEGALLLLGCALLTAAAAFLHPAAALAVAGAYSTAVGLLLSAPPRRD